MPFRLAVNVGNRPVKYRVTVKNVGRSIAVSTLTNAGCDIFQMGLNERDAGGRLYGALPSSSVNALKQWAASSPSRVLLGSQSYPCVLRTGDFTSKRGAKNPMHPTPVGSPVINSGPFGRVADFNQGGGWRGVLAGY